MNTHKHVQPENKASEKHQQNKDCNYANDYYGDRQCKPCQHQN